MSVQEGFGHHCDCGFTSITDNNDCKNYAQSQGKVADYIEDDFGILRPTGCHKTPEGDINFNTGAGFTVCHVNTPECEGNILCKELESGKDYQQGFGHHCDSGFTEITSIPLCKDIACAEGGFGSDVTNQNFGSLRPSGCHADPSGDIEFNTGSGFTECNVNTPACEGHVMCAPLCVDTDNGAKDRFGDPCGPEGTNYYRFPGWCGNYDDNDFDSKDMCCACGGGTTNGNGVVFAQAVDFFQTEKPFGNQTSPALIAVTVLSVVSLLAALAGLFVVVRRKKYAEVMEEELKETTNSQPTYECTN